MAEPGRNTPCPCGSGLKYKRCWEAFYGPQGRPPGQKSIEDDVYLDWLYFDVRNNRGLRLVDLLLRTKGLPRGIRAYAAAMRDSAIRLYEVNGRGRQALLRDVLTGRTYVLAGAVDAPVALLAARVVTRGASGRAELAGPGLSFPGFLRAELVGLLRDELAALRRAGGGAAGDEWKALAPILYRRWCSYAHAPQAPASAPAGAANDAAREAAEVQMHAEFANWIDAASERLAGATPRAAAESPELRPRLVDLLRELEAEYERRLTLDEPAFDPSLLWDDLGLRALRDGDRDHPPPLGHETMAALLPGFADVAEEVARRHRDARDRDLEWTIPQEIVVRDPQVRRFLQDQVDAHVGQGFEPQEVDDVVRLLAAQLVLLSNFQLHLRKVFWVADALSWMFGASSLEGVYGSALRLPFGCLALVFTDRYALGLAERLLARTPDVPLRGRILRILTVYLHNVTLPGGRYGIRVVFTCDADGDEWPAVFGRDFPVDPEARVVDILANVAPGTDAGELAPLWSCVPLRHLLHLVVHAVLEVTSTRGQQAVREPPPSRPDTPRRERRTEERVFDLPGTIDIRVLRGIQEAKRGAVSVKGRANGSCSGRANGSWSSRSARTPGSRSARTPGSRASTSTRSGRPSGSGGVCARRFMGFGTANRIGGGQAWEGSGARRLVRGFR